MRVLHSESSSPLPDVIYSNLHVKEGTISGAVISDVCPAPITRVRTGNTEFKKLRKVVEERIQDYRNYKVPR